MTEKNRKFEIYNKQRNDVTEIVRKAKIEHFQKFFEKNKQDCRKTWEGIINSIIHPRGIKKKAAPKSLEFNGVIVTDKKDKASTFYDFLRILVLILKIKSDKATKTP